MPVNAGGTEQRSANERSYGRDCSSLPAVLSGPLPRLSRRPKCRSHLLHRVGARLDPCARLLRKGNHSPALDIGTHAVAVASSGGHGIVLAALADHRLEVHDVYQYRRSLIASGCVGGNQSRAGHQQDAFELLQFVLGNTADSISVKAQHTYPECGAIMTNRPEVSLAPIVPV